MTKALASIRNVVEETWKVFPAISAGLCRRRWFDPSPRARATSITGSRHISRRRMSSRTCIASRSRSITSSRARF